MIEKYEQIGYFEIPKDYFSIAGTYRAPQPISWIPTILSLTYWEFLYSIKLVAKLYNELGGTDVPSIYILMDTSHKRVFIGEARKIVKYLYAKIELTKNKSSNWDKVIVINTASSLGALGLKDRTVRLVLKDYIVKLFKINNYVITIKTTNIPSLSEEQKTLVNRFKDELAVLLVRNNKITKLIAERGEEYISSFLISKFP